MKQRDLFYGEKKKSRKRSRKKSKKVLPVCKRRVGKVEADEIEVKFNNSSVTGYGGYPITRRFFKWVKLNRYFAQHIHIGKRSNGYTIPEMGSYLIDSKVLGLERLMHVEVLRHDPLLTKSYGIGSLPAGKTLGDYLKSYDGEKNESLERMNTRMNQETSRRVIGNTFQRVIVDYDSSTMTVYGKQEGADRGRSFRKKDKPGFQPKFAFIGGLDLMVNQQLYPESYNLQKEFMPFHQETLKKLPDMMEVVGVRGDTALFSESNVRYFEGQGYVYGISAPMNGPLREAVWQIEDEEWVECQDERGRIMSVARIEYKPKTWKGERKYTFIVSRRLRSHLKQEVLFPQDKYKYFAYITNKKGTIVEQFTFCVERCSLERCIKEAKLGFDIDSLPCAEYEANRAYLGHVQLAYNLAIFFKLSLLPKGVNRWTIDTIRRRLIAIPGNLVAKSSGWVLRLPNWWPYKDIFRYAERRLLSLQPG